ncbi:MAG: 30S ribosomal protein S14 [Fimbriimonas sp.]
MAKQCLIEKQRNYEDRILRLREEEKRIKELPKEARDEAMAKLTAQRVKQRLFKTRYYTRCAITGRARGVFRYFGVCRHVFREKAHRGELPGVKKSSW